MNTSASFPPVNTTYDVIVVGSGAAGLSTAVTAAIHGLKVLVVEKEDLFGGTTARSGGVLWVPGNRKFPQGQVPASADPASYMRSQAGENFNAAKVSAFLESGPEMVSFMESRTSAVRFIPAHGFSDYHPDEPGGCVTGRSIAAEPYDARLLGEEIQRLRPPLREITLLGMMLNASQDIKHLFNATKSLRSAIHVAKLITQYIREMVVYRRPMRLTNGNALVARLARSALDLGVEIHTSSAVKELLRDGKSIVGVRVQRDGQLFEYNAARGVVLACGGFPLDKIRTAQLFPHVQQGDVHLSPAAPGNTGDGLRLAEAVGGYVPDRLPNAAAWIPMSRVPDKAGRYRVFPHLIDRYKPGVIAVDRKGRRFTNESNSYHDFGKAMLKDQVGEPKVSSWLICDHRSIRKYGLGFVKPFPFPLQGAIKSGYLVRSESIAGLAQQLKLDASTLEQTIKTFNNHAVSGGDPEFGRGSTAYNRYLGDPEHKPNPCVAPLNAPPFYAIKLKMGDLGTFAGLDTDEHARVLNPQGEQIPGLYAVGNDAESIMGGNYPGGGITLGPGMTFGFIAAKHMAAKCESAELVEGADLFASTRQTALNI
jgi:hypothetical protein